MTKTLTRETVDTIITRALDRLTEDEREELVYDTYYEAEYIYEYDFSIYEPNTELLNKYAVVLDVDVNDLATLLSPYNIIEYDDEVEKIVEN